jgi:hypothetical protein
MITQGTGTCRVQKGGLSSIRLSRSRTHELYTVSCKLIAFTKHNMPSTIDYGLYSFLNLSAGLDKTVFSD